PSGQQVRFAGDCHHVGVRSANCGLRLTENVEGSIASAPGQLDGDRWPSLLGTESAAGSQLGRAREVLTINMCEAYVDGQQMPSEPPVGEVPYGTLDLMVLKTLQVMGALHGYAIARRIEQLAQGSLALNQGTIYPALLRLEQKGWITSKWGVSETKRRVRFFTITRVGLRQLAAEQRTWARTGAILNRLLEEA